MEKRKRKTDRLDETQRDALPSAQRPPFGTDLGSATLYVPLPAHLTRSGAADPRVRWRIELHDLAPGEGPLGVDVLGDVVLGRGKGGSLAPDLNMEPYAAFTKGVSRRHALLRPTMNNLYVIDLGSTNGTFHNAIQLGPGVARVLSHNDTLTLGTLSFTVKVVKKPETKPLDSEKKEKSPAPGKRKADDTKPFEVGIPEIAASIPPGSPPRGLAIDDEGPPTIVVTPPPKAAKPAPTTTHSQSLSEEEEEPESAKKMREEEQPESTSPESEAKAKPQGKGEQKGDTG